jgi:hypothetical protein
MTLVGSVTKLGQSCRNTTKWKCAAIHLSMYGKADVGWAAIGGSGLPASGLELTIGEHCSGGNPARAIATQNDSEIVS